MPRNLGVRMDGSSLCLYSQWAEGPAGMPSGTNGHFGRWVNAALARGGDAGVIRFHPGEAEKN